MSTKRYRAPLPEALATAIGSVWRSSLLNVRAYDRRPMILDAPTISYIAEGTRPTSATVCGEQKQKLSSTRLGRISILLYQFVKASAEERSELLGEIEEQIKVF